MDHAYILSLRRGYGKGPNCDGSAGDRRGMGGLMEHLPAYAGLFGAAFLSATVFPFQSEVVLFGMLTAEHYQA
jgi:hypothetical protein